MKKDEEGFIDFRSRLDPDVSNVLRAGQNKSLPRAARAKVERQRAKNEAARERRADYLLDPAIIEFIKTTARGLGCTESQVVTFAGYLLKQAIEQGSIDLNQYTQPIQNPRYKVRLNFPES